MRRTLPLAERLVPPSSDALTPGALMPDFSLENLLSCLDLRDKEQGTYVGESLALNYHRVFGGQLLGQTVRPAAGAAGEGKVVKSLAQLFPREGDSATPITYTVTKHQEGRTFGSSAVVASQGEKTISLATVSLHTPDGGPERSDPAPQVGAPEDAEPTALG